MVFPSSSSAFAANVSPPFGGNSSSFGGFSSSAISWGNASTASFGNQIKGSAVQSYSVTKEIDSNGRYGIGRIHSISAMPIYESKSHEELRFEDYRLKQGSTFSIQKPANTFQQPNNSTFSFNSTPTVSNMQPFSGFSNGFRPSSTFSFNSSTCASEAPKTQGLWSTSASVFPSISGLSGPTFSTQKPENAFQQPNNSSFSFNSTPTVSNVQPWSGFNSGFRPSSTFSFNSSTCAFEAPKTQGLWSTSASVFPSISGLSGPTFSTQKPANTFQQPNNSTFSSNSTPAVAHSGSAHAVSNVQQPMSGFRPSSTFSFNSSTCAFQAPTTQGFAIKPTPSLWSTSSSVVPSTSIFSGNQQKGSALASYSATRGVDGEFGTKIQSISAMPIYEDKSHEELRLEDYELRNKPSNHSSANSQAFVSNNNNSTIFKPSTFSPPLNPPNISPFSSTATTSIGIWPSFLKPSQPAEKTELHSTTNNSLNQPLSSSCFTTCDKPANISSNVQPWSINHSSANSQAFVTNSNNNNSTISPSSTFSPPLNPPNISPFSSSTPSSAVSPSIGLWPSFPKPSQPEKTGSDSTTNNNSLSTQPSPQALNSSTMSAEVAAQNINAQQQYVPSSTVGMQPVNTIGIRYAPIQHGTSSSIQVPSRIPSLSIRHVSSRHNRMPDRGHSRGRSSEPKVPFSSNEEYRPFPIDPLLPRENPRACFINSHRIFQGTTASGSSPSNTRLGKGCEDKACPSASFKLNVDEEDDNDAAIEKHDAEVLSLMPKLPFGENYYTKPCVRDLAVREMAEPGFCSRVNNFVVGRKDYGSIKFLGETDIRYLDIGSIIRFNNREVIVYPDDIEKPPAGESLNKPAEVTLLNVKCVSKKTGKEYVDGFEVQSYKEMLMKKASRKGAEFVSYDPVTGEWKFRVQHF